MLSKTLAVVDTKRILVLEQEISLEKGEGEQTFLKGRAWREEEETTEGQAL